MNPPLTDIERISRFKCQTKGCPNKASAIFKTKPLCKECKSRIHPTAIDKRCYYVNYIHERR